MNCKQGDLAVIVRSTIGNEGKVLTCLRLATSAECRAKRFDHGDWLGPVWVTDASIRHSENGRTCLYPDSRLRPLRNSGGEDEMLQIAGKPGGVRTAQNFVDGGPVGADNSRMMRAHYCHLAHPVTARPAANLPLENLMQSTQSTKLARIITPLAVTTAEAQANLGALFITCGTTRIEAGFTAFPASLVSPRQTHAEELASRMARHDGDAAGHARHSSHSEVTVEGDQPHVKYGVRFEYAYGTSLRFAPH